MFCFIWMTRFCWCTAQSHFSQGQANKTDCWCCSGFRQLSQIIKSSHLWCLLAPSPTQHPCSLTLAKLPCNTSAAQPHRVTLPLQLWLFNYSFSSICDADKTCAARVCVSNLWVCRRVCVCGSSLSKRCDRRRTPRSSFFSSPISDELSLQAPPPILVLNPLPI